MTIDLPLVLLQSAPPLSGETLTLGERQWRVHVMAVWPSGPGHEPDFDILCHLHPVDGRASHHILFEIDRRFIQRRDCKESVLRAIERKFAHGDLPTFARIDAAEQA